MPPTEKISIVIEAEDNASSTIDKVKSGFSSISSGVRMLDSGLRQYNSTMSTFNRGLINIVRDAGSAIYDFTSDSISNFSELSEQHAKTLGVMANDYDKTLESQQRFMENSEKLKQQAIDLAKYGVNGSGSLVSPSEISALQTELAKAGIKGETMLNTGIVGDVLQFAQANQLDNATAVEFAVSLGSQFGVPYEQWREMLDKVSHTADMSVIDVKDIVASMKYAGGISSSLDRPMDEVLGMIAILGNFGLRGSQAGSGIQAFLTRLLTGDTTVISDAMAEVAPENALKAFYDFSNYAKSEGSDLKYEDIINAETYDELSGLTGELRPMTEIMDALESTMESLNDEEQAWFAKKLFGLYQMKSAYALINGDDKSEKSLNDVIKEIENNSSGTNENKLNEILRSQSGQMEATINLIEAIKTEVGNLLSPTVLTILGEAQSFLKDPKNYNISWIRIKDSLDESCDAIEEKYGTAVANAVRNIGNLTIDLGQVVEEIGPEFITGLFEVFSSASDMNFFGEDSVTSNWGLMIDNMDKALETLPPDLQELGSKVVDVIDMFGKLAALNIATNIAQLVTSTLQLALMTVRAGSVIVNGAINTGGGGTGTGAAVSTITNKTKFGSADDVAKALGTTTDDVVATFGKKSSYTIDDIAKGLGTNADDVIAAYGDDLAKGLLKSGGGALSKLAKGLGVAGTIWQVGSTAVNAYDDFSNDNVKGGIEEITGGAGAMGGAVLGTKGGAAIGSAFGPAGTVGGGIIGAIVGALMGDNIGRNVSGSIYDDISNQKNGVYDTGINRSPIPTPTPAPSMILENDNKENIGPVPVPTPPIPATINDGYKSAPTQVIDISSIIPGINAMSNNARNDILQNYFNNLDVNQIPVFNMEAPKIQVSVTIDKDGNVISQEQSILNPEFARNINRWYQKSSTQMGSTTR